ncbi:unnamed protein product [Phytophthora fragariaefolia]|uniref:Unnamed protein product n=1 Tax=Phytophthora fragariaefolia TaxID=1490495 RepID=A0A9W7CQR7_9STRA|nr:unnamed protein product [Phytophthora fragariaefolia]
MKLYESQSKEVDFYRVQHASPGISYVHRDDRKYSVRVQHRVTLIQFVLHESLYMRLYQLTQATMPAPCCCISKSWQAPLGLLVRRGLPGQGGTSSSESRGERRRCFTSTTSCSKAWKTQNEALSKQWRGGWPKQHPADATTAGN